MAAQCTLDGCERPHASKGFCAAHYMRWRMDNDMAPPIRKRGTERAPCSLEGCERKSKAKGLCNKHYDQQRPKRK
jgi:hypothetical protein